MGLFSQGEGRPTCSRTSAAAAGASGHPVLLLLLKACETAESADWKASHKLECKALRTATCAMSLFSQISVT